MTFIKQMQKLLVLLRWDWSAGRALVAGAWPGRRLRAGRQATEHHVQLDQVLEVLGTAQQICSFSTQLLRYRGYVEVPVVVVVQVTVNLIQNM